MSDEVSRTVLPNQLVIPQLWDETRPVEASTSLVEASTSEPETLEPPIEGQGVLFVMPSVVTRDDGRREPSPTETGEAGQSLVRAICNAHGLGHMEPHDPGHEGFDCYVEGKRVQVKATSQQAPDGRFSFNAGRCKRFDRYRDKCDLFVFVITSSASDLYGCMRWMEAGVVINRWPGPKVHLQPTDFPRRPDLTLLMPPVTDQVINELLRT